MPAFGTGNKHLKPTAPPRASHPSSTFLHVDAAAAAHKRVSPAGVFTEVVRVLEEAGYRRCVGRDERGTPTSVIRALLHPGFKMDPSSLGKVLRLLGVTRATRRGGSGREYSVTLAA